MFILKVCTEANHWIFEVATDVNIYFRHKLFFAALLVTEIRTNRTVVMKILPPSYL